MRSRDAAIVYDLPFSASVSELELIPAIACGFERM